MAVIVAGDSQRMQSHTHSSILGWSGGVWPWSIGFCGALTNWFATLLCFFEK